jgi:Acyl-CoA dehydrogenase, N-terminal domain
VSNAATDRYQDLRDAVRALCAQFPDEYHRKIDEQRAYPEAFVEALTKAGWLAAMIPSEYGGAGLGLAEASVQPMPRQRAWTPCPRWASIRKRSSPRWAMQRPISSACAGCRRFSV